MKPFGASESKTNYFLTEEAKFSKSLPAAIERYQKYFLEVC